MFYVIGVGPGGVSYLTKAAEEAMIASEVLIGARRHLDSFAASGKETLEISASNIKDIIKYIAENKGKKQIGVLVSGDPGFFSFGKLILDKFNNEEFEVIPGISSIQLAFSKLKKTWEDTAFVSLHGRKIDSDLIEDVSRKIDMFQSFCFLGDKDIDPIELSEHLISREKYNTYILNDLSLPGEKIINLNNKDKVDLNGSGNWILVLEKK